ncbi:hypothetical protein R5R35_012844 [Gryllus longicercus]|uniref:U11/U12 small nuclear ribonucleoprotein 35 kDa protein n=1 Tax=Gryllus longicercus TaxID=2509291 RepID=A0AAN9VKZ5_9ORTH
MASVNPYSKHSRADWSRLHKKYDPLKAGSIDGTDTEPHDHGIERALEAEYFPDRNVKGNPECTLFVAKLSKSTTEKSLKKAFVSFGRIRRCRVVRDIVTGTSKGYGFVEFEDQSSASMAYVRSSKLTVDGNLVFVDFECERLLPGWIPRRLGGGFGGKKESGQLRFGGRARPFKKPLVPGTSQQIDDGRRKD